MNDKTPGDKVWTVLISKINNRERFSATELANEAQVNYETALNRVHIAEDEGLLVRNTEEGSTCIPTPSKEEITAEEGSIVYAPFEKEGWYLKLKDADSGNVFLVEFPDEVTVSELEAEFDN